MKKIYKNPTITVVYVQPTQLLADSIRVGNAYQTNDAVLSREADLWDDEDY